MLQTPKTHEEYARRVGAPVVVRCEIDLDGRWYVWICRTHDYGFNDRAHALDTTFLDRCPMSRLEEWRQRRWDAA